MSSLAASLLVGNRYQLLDPVGRGAMGAVYRAIDRLSDETVALKRVSIPAGTRESGATLRLALAREFQTLASLRHPHIISVLDYGFDAQRQPFFTMDLLQDPRTILEAGLGQPPNAQVALLIQVLQALAYLHRRGILHRDLKPANVLVTVQGRVKLLDFGLAGALAQSTTGTLAYMAPEVLRGDTAGQAADLYAVGVIAYQLLVGRHPFETRHPTQLLAGILYAAPDLSGLANPHLAAVLARWLAKDPNQRYASAGEVVDALSTATGQPVPEESRAIRESFLAAARFVGRDAELAQLTGALQQAAEGKGSAWLVGGESGVGKSRLLDELRTQALVAGATVVRGQTVEDRGAPYQVWREPLRRLALIAGPDDLSAGIVKPLAPDIPELVGRSIPDAPDLEGEAARQRLHLTLAEICRQAARACSPLVLLLEDLHWASAGLEPLKVLARGLADLPLLVVGAYCSEERPDLPAECPMMNHLSLNPLSPSSMSELIISMLGPDGAQPQLSDLLQRETEGNAFFLVETVRTLAEEAGRLQEVPGIRLPETIFSGGIQQIIRRRLARVPASHRPLLKLAAVAGRNLDLEVLRAAQPHVHLETWLADCTSVAALQAREGSWRFIHDKLRAELLDELDDAERPSLHRQVAEAYERVHPGNPAYAAALTAHWEAAAEGGAGVALEKAARYARIAGEYAAAQYAGADAVRFLSKALALTPEADAAGRYELHLASEQVYDRQGNREAQAADLARLGALARTASQRCEIALHTGAYHNQVGEYDAALAASEQARRWAAEGEDRAGQAQALIVGGQALMQKGIYGHAKGRCRRAAEIAGAAGAPIQLARARSILGKVAHRRGDYPAARRQHEAALRLQQEIDDRPGQVQSLRHLGEVANAQADYDAARGYYLAALKLARQIGDRPQEGQILLDLGEIDWRQGAFQRAAVSLQESLALARSTGDRFTAAAVLNGMGIVASQQGRYAEAVGYWEQSLAIKQEIGDRAGASKTLNNLGTVARRQKEYDRAIRYYEQSLAIKQEIGDLAGMDGTLQNMGVVAEGQGQYDRALDYYERGLAIARKIGDRAAEGMMLTNLGRVAWHQGQHDRAIEYHRQSLDIARETGGRDVEVNALTNLGLVTEQLGRYGEAEIYYERSLDVRQEMSDRSGEGITLNHLGAAALLQSAFRLAESYYRQALAIRQELGQSHYQAEDWAGLALAALRGGDRTAAQAWAEQLLAAWAANPTFDKAEEPMRALYFTWQVCRELEWAQADDILAAAGNMLQSYLDNHPDREAQSVYLQQPYHRALWQARSAQAPNEERR